MSSVCSNPNSMREKLLLTLCMVPSGRKVSIPLMLANTHMIPVYTHTSSSVSPVSILSPRKEEGKSLTHMIPVYTHTSSSVSPVSILSPRKEIRRLSTHMIPVYTHTSSSVSPVSILSPRKEKRRLSTHMKPQGSKLGVSGAQGYLEFSCGSLKFLAGSPKMYWFLYRAT